MNIILGTENAKQAEAKYTVLELDTLMIEKDCNAVTAYCLIEQVPIDQMSQIENSVKLHQDLMKNYRQRNWNYCEQAITHLMGQWGGELDSFYTELSRRVANLRQSEPAADWQGYLVI
jgi:hypothetical protein